MAFNHELQETITPGSTKSVVTASSSATIALPTDAAGNNAWRYALVCLSTGSAWVKFGTSAVAATTQDLAITATRRILVRPPSATHLAYIQTVIGTAVLSIAALDN